MAVASSELRGSRRPVTAIAAELVSKACQVVLCALLPCAAMAGDARQIDDSMQLLLGAQEITKQYVPSLGLPGKSMRHAMNVMLAAGFSCRINKGVPSGMPPPFDWPPSLLFCAKEHAGLAEKCDDVSLSIVPKRDVRLKSGKLLDLLGVVEVDHVSVFCPWKISASKGRYGELLRARDNANRELAQRIEVLHLARQTAASAVMAFLDAGDSCGLDFSDNQSAKSGESSKLICEAWPSGIRECYRAKTVLELSSPIPNESPDALAAQLKSAIVKTVHSNCELPPVDSDPEV